MKGHHEAGGHPIGLIGLRVAAKNRHVTVLFCGPRYSRLFLEASASGTNDMVVEGSMSSVDMI